MKISEILKDSSYKLDIFSPENIEELENRIVIKEVRKQKKPYVECLIRKKEILLTPEEIVRQLYLDMLLNQYKYPKDRIALEYPIQMGSSSYKKADIVIFDKDKVDTTYIIVELKKPNRKDGKEQLKSYCNATGCPIGVWTNGSLIQFFRRSEPNYFEDLERIPTVNERLKDILNERVTFNDLIKKDRLVNERLSLKDLILDLEDEVLANAGVDVFEELFKLVFTKLYDEFLSRDDKERALEFRNVGETERELYEKIVELFEDAKEKWSGIFKESDKIELIESHLAICISSLQNVKLFNSNLEVVDEAFEYLVNKSSKGEKGQYFTPRYVIDMCVKMLNPSEDENMIDTASGSCGFTVHTIFEVWRKIAEDEKLKISNVFSLERKTKRMLKYVREKVFAIDFDERAVRVGRTLNLIAGDGETNVFHLNSLDYSRWDEKIKKDRNWITTYGKGFEKLEKLKSDKKSYSHFNFDIVMANPPFAGDIKDNTIIHKYELGQKLEKRAGLALNIPTRYKGWHEKISRDVLFIERNINFLKAGGRMAVVLPQGRFNNSSDFYLRKFIHDKCRILAVIGLHGNTFKPHTGTKTSVLLVQKWDEVLCPKVEDYNIFFATQQKSAKDNSGDKIYLEDDFVDVYEEGKDGFVEYRYNKFIEKYGSLENAIYYDDKGEPLHYPIERRDFVLDSHGHLVVEHDLFAHEDLLPDGVAEAFIEFAKKEKLSFVGK